LITSISAGSGGEGRCFSEPLSWKTRLSAQILAASLILALIALTAPVQAATDAAVFFAGCPNIDVTEDTAVTGMAVVAGPCTVTVADGVRSMKFEQLDLETDHDLTIDGTAANKLLVLFKNSTVEVHGGLSIATGRGNVSIKENSSLTAGGVLVIGADDGDILIKASDLDGGVVSVTTESGDIVYKESSMAASALFSVLATVANGDITVKDSDFSTLVLGIGIFAADKALVKGNDFNPGFVGLVLITGNPCISKSNDPAVPCS